jgi:type II secretory pathway pseudopilin PulG
MIELIGVLAVIALLIGILLPPIVRRVDRSTWTRETTDLNSLADSLTQSILRTRTVPSATNLAGAIAAQMTLPVSTVATNSRRNARALLVDPALSINGAALPYSQTNNGASSVVSARVIILSSLSRGLPIATGVPSTNDFTNIWNAAENTVPGGTAFAGWGGTGEDLRIRKINLEPLFYQMILVDHRSDTNNPPSYSVDGSSVTPVPAGPLGLNKFYFDGTVIGLHYSDANGVTQLQSRHLLKRNISFLFESGTWRGQVQGDQQAFSAGGADFFNHAITFFNHAVNPAAASGGSQYGVMIAMYTFMFDYTYWANECPHFTYHGNNASAVPEYVLLNNQGQGNGNIDRFSSELIAHP